MTYHMKTTATMATCPDENHSIPIHSKEKEPFPKRPHHPGGLSGGNSRHPYSRHILSGRISLNTNTVAAAYVNSDMIAHYRYQMAPQPYKLNLLPYIKHYNM